MSVLSSTKFSVRAVAPAALCLGLAAVPALAWACDMQAVNDELAREAKAEALAPLVQAAADPSGDPSGSEQQPPGNAEPSAQSSGAGSKQAQPNQAASKPAAPMGHSGTSEPSEKK